MVPDEPHAPRPGYLLNGVKRGDPRNAPRCGAKTRKGTPCQGPAMKNGRCRMHGGASTGPRTPEGLARSRRARWKHGGRSAEAISLRRALAAIERESRQRAQEWRALSPESRGRTGVSTLSNPQGGEHL